MSYLQVVMIQHAAMHNRRMLDRRIEEKRHKRTLSASEEIAEYGKPFSELTSEELLALSSSEGAVKVIHTKKVPKPEADD